MNPLKLSEEWASYRERVMPIDSPPTQVQECQRAFYAGAQAICGVLTTAMASGSPDDPPTPAEEAQWASLMRELDAFAERVGSAAETAPEERWKRVTHRRRELLSAAVKVVRQFGDMRAGVLTLVIGGPVLESALEDLQDALNWLRMDAPAEPGLR